MFKKLSGNTLFSKIVAAIISIGFILSSVPVSYARTDSLRPKATRGADGGIITAFEHEGVRRVLARLDARNSKYTVRKLKDEFGEIHIQAVDGMTEAIYKETGIFIRGHYAIRPDENGISYVYIDKDTYNGEFGELYVEHELFELRAIREFAKVNNWKLDELVNWLDLEGRASEVRAVLGKIHDEAPELPEGSVEIVRDLPRRITLTVAQRRPVRGAAGAGQAADLVTMTMDELKTQIKQKGITSGFIGLDWNVGKVDKTEDLERIRKSVPTIDKAFNDGIQYLFGFTHRGSPKGVGFEANEKLMLKPVIDKARDFLKGLDIEIVALSYDLEKAKQEIAEAKAKYPGKKIFFILENIRFYAAEQSKDKGIRAEFEKKLIELTGCSAEQLVYISEHFDKAHRGSQASVELVTMIPKENRAAGIAFEQDLNAVVGFLKGLSGTMTVMFGGAKFDKFSNIATISEETLKQRKGAVLIAGAQANAWEKFANSKEVGKSLLPKDEEAGEVRQAVETIKSSGVEVLAPVDYIVKIGDKALEEPQKVLATDMSQVDVGPETIALFRERIRSLKAGDGLILNGGTGMFDKGFPQGTFALIEEAEVASDRGVSVLFAGGDMHVAAQEYERAKGRALNPKIKRTTGGGVVWTIIAKNVVENPKGMPAVEAVLKTVAPVVAKPTPEIPTVVEPIFPNQIPLGSKLTVGGNWKLRPFKNEAEARAKAREFKAKFAGIDPNAEIVLFVEDKWMKSISEELQGSNIRVGVQSFHFKPPTILDIPSYPNEIEQQIQDAVSKGAKYAMIGHSMHRNPDPKVLPGIAPLRNEGANIIVKEILRDGRLKLWYVIAINELPNKSLSEQEGYIKKQIDEGVNIGLDGVTEGQLANIIITAEPTADISTKAGDGWIDPKTRVNFPKVELLARLLNEALTKKFGSAVSKVNTGYGASASPETAATLLSHPNVFNILPGGKSLEANDFYGTVTNAIIGKYGSHGLDVELAQKLGVGVDKVRTTLILNKTAYTTRGGQAFSGYTKAVAGNLGEQPLALIVTPECFKMAGMNNTLKEIEKLGSIVKVAVYGEKADNLRTWVGNKDIITAGNFDELLEELIKAKIDPEDMVILKAKEEKIDDTNPILKEIRQVDSGDIATLAVAKAVKELLGNANAEAALRDFLSKIDGKVIEKINEETQKNIVKKMEALTYAFPEEVRVTQQVGKDVEEVTIATAEVLDI